MRSDILPNSTDTRRFYLVLGFMIVIAWGLLLVWQRSAYAELLGHESLEDNDFPLVWHLAAFLLSWFLMTVAMMMPGSLAVLNHYVQPVQHQIKNTRLVVLIILGYLSPWVLFGLLVYLGDSFLHRMFDPTAPLAAFSASIAPAIMLIAGLYQFTPLKRRYTLRCRPAHALFLRGSVEKIYGAETLNQGLRLGVYCVGSCWPLMLLMFALGHNRVDLMLVLSLIMAAERLAPWGHRLAWLVGLALIVWATFWVLASPGHP